MSAPGVLAMPGGILTRTPAWLTEELVTLLSSTLKELAIADDLIDDNPDEPTGYVGSVVARAGVDLTNSTASHFPHGIDAGRKYVGPGVLDTGQSLRATFASACKCFTLVADGCAPARAYDTLVDSYAHGAAAGIRDALTASFYTVNGWSHLVDGVVTETIPSSGLHIFSAVNLSNVYTGVAMGGNVGAGRSWQGRMFCLIGTSTEPDHAALRMKLKQYYPSLP